MKKQEVKRHLKLLIAEAATQQRKRRMEAKKQVSEHKGVSES